MTELELYKFVHNAGLEYHWHERNDNNNAHDVLLFVPIYWIKDFNDLLGYQIMAEEGIECTMKHGYFCFWMKDICDHFDITPANVFDQEK
jgi:hypothetical protein